MSYDPLEYWSKRKDLKEQPERDWVNDYIIKHTLGHHILDYGTGTGNKLHLFKDLNVTGVDIVDIYRDRWLKKAEELLIKAEWSAIKPKQQGLWHFKHRYFSTILVSKVFLHCKPDSIVYLIEEMMRISDKIIVFDLDIDCYETEAEHVFLHNFADVMPMKNVVRKHGQILFHT